MNLAKIKMNDEYKDALLRVIDQRIDILDKVIEKATGKDAEWYDGRRTGLADASELLKSSLEELKIELNEA